MSASRPRNALFNPGENCVLYVNGVVIGRMERENKTNSTDEIEITPEMIEAGEDVLLCALGGAVSSHWFPDELAKQVYLAMVKHSPKKSGRSRKQISKG